jgi:GNAT superfamily N-acetyltransferase
MHIRLRLADPDSPAALACLRAYYAELAVIFPGGFDPGPLPGPDSAELRAPQGAFVLAWEGDQAIGCVALRRQAPGLGEVKRLWVSPSARGTGLALALMGAIEAEARRLAMTRLVLDTSRHLPKAVAFYHRHGWTETARYNENPYAHHWFSRDLAEKTPEI